VARLMLCPISILGWLSLHVMVMDWGWFWVGLVCSILVLPFLPAADLVVHTLDNRRCDCVRVSDWYQCGRIIPKVSSRPSCLQVCCKYHLHCVWQKARD
jgi:hypothetical protein